MLSVKTIFGAFLLFGISGTAMAQNIVVRSVGPSAKSYPAGKKLNNSSKITLKKLDKVTILSSGGTRVLKGPGTFSLGTNARTKSTTSTRLSSFISNRSKRRARTGAIRSTGATVSEAAPTNPNLWNLDITKSGKFCVSDPARLVLWRPDYTGSATASIVDPANGNITEIAWRKGNPLKAWPKATVPLTNGARYQLIGSNVPKTAEVNFVLLATAPDNLDDAATALLENGCQNQINLLADMIENTAPDGENADGDSATEQG